MKHQAKLAGMKLGMAWVEAERRAAEEIRRIEAKRRARAKEASRQAALVKDGDER